jgi:hypothetical protein
MLEEWKIGMMGEGFSEALEGVEHWYSIVPIFHEDGGEKC